MPTTSTPLTFEKIKWTNTIHWKDEITNQNEENQIEQIETKQGIIYLSYDENGNLSKKIHEDGQVDEYQYDEWDQLVQLEQGKDVYEYEYDAQGERIAQTYTDTQD